jgi:orotate phosphoribosyltransferase
MNITAEDFKNHILESDILDPEGVHHELIGGMHGQKLDFGKIPDGSQLLEEWIEITAQTIHEVHTARNLGKLMLLSVATGTDRLVDPVAQLLGENVSSALTYKVTPEAVKLTIGAKHAIRSREIDLIIALEDVAKTGASSAMAVSESRDNGAKNVEVLNTWQRSAHLRKLEEIGAGYHSIIREELPTYSDAYCKDVGYCAHDWELITYGH